MKSVFILLLLFFSIPSIAQDSTFRYIRVTLRERFMANKISVELDRGQDSTYFKLKDPTVLSVLRQAETMPTLMDYLGFMEDHGWKVFHFTPPSNDGNSHSYRIYFRRAFGRHESL